jgi:hypothetical protein
MTSTAKKFGMKEAVEMAVVVRMQRRAHEVAGKRARVIDFYRKRK